MSIATLRQAIVDKLKTELGVLASSVQPHGGRFTEEELKRYSAKMPGVFVACLGISETELIGGEPYAHFEWVAFAATKDASVVGSRSELVLTLGAELTRIVSIERWDFDGAGVAEKVRGNNIYSADLDKAGVALWVTSWTQALPLEPPTAPELDTFETFTDSFDLAPADSVIDGADQVALETT